MMMEERILTKCPNCKLRTLHREGEELVCSECKGRFAASKPEKKRLARHHMSRAEIEERHKYYEQNKEAILADVKAMGVMATGEKWKIPGGTMSTLRRRWQKHTDTPKPSNNPKTAWEKHEYYEKHKEEILGDLKVLGSVATKQKWNLPPSTLNTLLTRWQVPLEEREPQNGGLPPLPLFNEAWDPEVQIKWLDVYAKIHGGAK